MVVTIALLLIRHTHCGKDWAVVVVVVVAPLLIIPLHCREDLVVDVVMVVSEKTLNIMSTSHTGISCATHDDNAVLRNYRVTVFRWRRIMKCCFPGQHRRRI